MTDISFKQEVSDAVKDGLHSLGYMPKSNPTEERKEDISVERRYNGVTQIIDIMFTLREK